METRGGEDSDTESEDFTSSSGIEHDQENIVEDDLVVALADCSKHQSIQSILERDSKIRTVIRKLDHLDERTGKSLLILS